MKYRIKVKNKDGDYLGEFDTYKDLVFGKRLNNFGECKFKIPLNDPKLSLIDLRKNEIEIFEINENQPSFVTFPDDYIDPSPIPEIDGVNITLPLNNAGEYTSTKDYDNDNFEYEWKWVDGTSKFFRVYLRRSGTTGAGTRNTDFVNVSSDGTSIEYGRILTSTTVVGTIPITTTSGDVFKVAMIDGLIHIYQNGVELGTYTPYFATGIYHGFRFFSSTVSLIKIGKPTPEIDDTRVWAGEQASMVNELTETGDNWAEITCYTYLEMLAHRYTKSSLSFVGEGFAPSTVINDILYYTQHDYVLVNPTSVTKSPTAVAEIEYEQYTNAWSNLNNILTEDGNFATTTNASLRNTKLIEASEFDFGLDNDKVVTGIKLEVKAKTSSASAFNNYFFVGMNSPEYNGINMANKEQLSTTNGYTSFGGEGNLLWTQTNLAGDDYNNAIFYVAFQMLNSTISVDHIKATIYYSEKYFIGDMGITTNGSTFVDNNPELESDYFNQNILQSFIDITNIYPDLDIDMTDNKVLNFYENKGELKNINLFYGKHISSARVTHNFSKPINRAIVTGQLSGTLKDVRAESEDVTSIEDIGLREAIDNQSTATSIDSFYSSGEMILNRYKIPDIITEFNLVKNSDFGLSDFVLGDRVTISVPTVSDSGQEVVRILQWTVVANNDGSSQLQLVTQKYS